MSCEVDHARSAAGTSAANDRTHAEKSWPSPGECARHPRGGAEGDDPVGRGRINVERLLGVGSGHDEDEAAAATCSGLIRWLRCVDASTPRSVATRCSFGSGVASLGAATPADATSASRPASCSSRCSRASASGERSRLPVQTTRTLGCRRARDRRRTGSAIVVTGMDGASRDAHDGGTVRHVAHYDGPGTHDRPASDAQSRGHPAPMPTRDPSPTLT